MTLQHYVNGRVLLRDHGGVRRYATEVSRHLTSAHVLTPSSAAHPWSGRVWEQTTLARSSADGVLLNMAHSGPVRHPRQVNLVHDLLALTDSRSVHPAYAALLRRQLPRHIAAARQLVTVSEHVATQIAGLFDVALGDIAIVPPGISDVFRPAHRGEVRTKLGLDPDRPVVAALLDPTPRKNSATVAELLVQVQNDDPRVQVIVAGRHRPAAFGRTAANTDADRRAFVDLGAVDDIDLAAMFQAADVFVSLSRAEGFGLPVVEAAVCGAAVVTTPVPSIVEQAPDGAVIIDGPQRARRAVLDLLENTERRHELTLAAGVALGDLQWERSAANLETMMGGVASP